MSLLVGNGDGTFAPRADFSAQNGPISAAIGDVDGDGRSDVLVSNSLSGTLQLMRNTGCGLVGVDAEPPASGVTMLRTYPNPSAGNVTVRFVLPESRRVDAGVFDVAGRKVASLAEGVAFGAGPHVLLWNHHSSDGRTMPGGLYLVRIRAGRDVVVARVVQLP